MTGPREPLSWLTLERYALGELDERERAQVAARLAVSEADRAVLAAIMNDESELRPLPEVAPTAAPRAASVPTRTSRGATITSRVARRSVPAILAVAAALLLWRVVPSRELDAPYEGVKGSEFALRLLSDRGGPNPRSFQLGERFKLEVTCPTSHQGPLRVLIYQGDERFEPLPPQTIACGNLVAWPGAFSLDGTQPAEVCLYSGTEREPPRGAPGLTCTTLEASFGEDVRR
jgi:hypothetical protein